MNTPNSNAGRKKRSAARKQNAPMKKRGANANQKSKRPSDELTAAGKPEPVGLSFSETDTLKDRIRVMVEILKKIEDGNVNSGSDRTGAAVETNTVASATDDSDSDKDTEGFKISLAWVARHAVNGLWDLVNHGNGKQARGALQLLMSELVYANAKIERLLKCLEKRAMVCEYAGDNMKFPILVSVFNPETLKASDRVKELGLGSKLPFKIAPNKTPTAYNMWAMRIVNWINLERSKHSSIYRLVEPSLEKKEFCSNNGSTWEKAIVFHLDYFQSPEKRWKTVESQLIAKLAGVDRERELAHLNNSVGPVGSVTDIPEFKTILTDENDQSVKTESDLYHRVKGKILRAVRSLMN